jgi:hypothetical protein
MSDRTHNVISTDWANLLLGDRTAFGTVAGYSTDWPNLDTLIILSDPYATIPLHDLFPDPDTKITVLRPV